MTTAPEIVRANWRNNSPVIPPMNAQGTKTASNTNVVAMTGPVISAIALTAASFGERPSARWRLAFSTTTIASSTTIPIARTIPNSESIFSEKPMPFMIAKVPISDTGIAATGTIVARQSCKKTKITMTTNTTARASVE